MDNTRVIMEVNTRFNIGDKVWYINDNRAVRSDITRVIISVESPGSCEVSYSLHFGDTEIPEGQLFRTKEELLKSL